MKNKVGKFLCFFEILISLLCFVALFIFGYSVFISSIVPVLYLVIGLLVSVFVVVGLVFLLFHKKNKFLKMIMMFLLVWISIGLFYVSNYFSNTHRFLNQIQGKEYDVLTYSIVVLKDRGYSTIFDLNGKSVAYLSDMYQSEVSHYFQEKINFNAMLESDSGSLASSLLTQKVDAICLEESYLLLIREEVENFEVSVTVLDTFEVKIDNSLKGEDSSFDTSFVLYISGIDQYGNVDKIRGRSDVNQLAVVNPKTRHILLVNTPRDYYVQLAGTTGLKDKLTHAGIYGIEKSIATLENLYGTHIDYYLRVNFDSLIKCVDVIGGIDIYSDSSFTCWTNRSVQVDKGWNHFNGTEALAYSRERYAYQTGDHHRGENQQQVITAILHKVSQSSVLISKYNQILNVLEDSFQTNMPPHVITSFVKKQLEDLSFWNVESIAVTGFGSKNYTYSMGRNHLLYVIEPDYSSVSEVAKRIEAVRLEQ